MDEVSKKTIEAINTAADMAHSGIQFIADKGVEAVHGAQQVAGDAMEKIVSGSQNLVNNANLNKPIESVSAAVEGVKNMVISNMKPPSDIIKDAQLIGERISSEAKNIVNQGVQHLQKASDMGEKMANIGLQVAADVTNKAKEVADKLVATSSESEHSEDVIQESKHSEDVIQESEHSKDVIQESEHSKDVIQESSNDNKEEVVMKRASFKR